MLLQQADTSKPVETYWFLMAFFIIGSAYFILTSRVNDGNGPTRWSLLCMWLSGLLYGNNKNSSVTSTSIPLSQRTPALLQADAGVLDTRQATLHAIAKLPMQIPLPEAQSKAVPLLFDGVRWHTFTPGYDGDWGVFGAKGSGKGNLLQWVALSVLQMGPDRANLVVLDGKHGLDYTFCNKVQHATLYKDETLIEGCKWLVAEMRKRNKTLEQAEARSWQEYEQKTGAKWQLIVFIVDEIADFPKECMTNLETLARMCRAAGMVGFYATQYPTTDVLSSQIQANVANRIAFRLVSSEYTRVALRRTRQDNGIYEPSAIPQELPGVGVLRRDGGREMMGRAPELTDNLRQTWIDWLAQQWGKTSQTKLENFSTTKTDFSAPQSDFDVSGLTFSNSEIAKIVAQIARGEIKTNVVTNMPGYESRSHRKFAAYYEQLKAAIEEQYVAA